ncbi:MAG: tetratricopeptide repeat protein, partial [Verrucomicrobia bacterium]|nr:tetratricopeptide repeat protein [Verrucomicrobiota bacterium]
MSDLDALKLALAASPENVHLRLLLAKAYIGEFQLEDARDQYLDALKLDSNSIDARLGLINVINMLGKTSEAIVRLDDLVRDAPNHAPAWIMRAHLALQEGDAQEAHGFYTRAVEISPAQADAALLKRIVQAGGKASPARPTPTPVSSEGGYGEAMLDSDYEDVFADGRPYDEGFPFDEVALDFSANPDVNSADVGGM